MYVMNAPLFIIALVLVGSFLLISVFIAVRLRKLEESNTSLSQKVELVENKINGLKMRSSIASVKKAVLNEDIDI